MRTISQHLPRAIFFLLFGVLLLGQTHPTAFSFLRAGLDPSWVAALSYANTSSLQYGSDVVFTMGPLVGLYSHGFDEQSAPLVLIIAVLKVAFYAAALSALAARSPRMGVVALVIFSITILQPDTVACGIPLIIVYVVVVRASENNTPLILLGSFLCAASTLSKFSALPLSLVGIIIADLSLAHRRRLPLASITFIACLIGLFHLCGQSISNLIPFLRGAIEVSIGYSAAMSIPGSLIEIVTFIAAMIVFGVLVFSEEYRACSSSRSTIFSSTAIILITAAFIFVSFKAGFVRHDRHSLIGWGGLVLAATIFGLTRQTAAIAIALLCIVPGHWLVTPPASVPSYPLKTFGSGLAEATTLFAIARNPENWLEANKTRLRESAKILQNQNPLPQLTGTVDTIPSVQSTVIANGLDYRPRPVLQEYVTYSPSLIARNRAYFQERAPDNLIMSPGSIDGRHPASTEGAQWPIILSIYEPAERIDDLVFLKKRIVPLPSLLGTPTTLLANTFDNVRIPDGPQMVAIKLELNYIGRILDFFLRPPFVKLVVSFPSGEKAYRLIPGMARDGFLISPLIENSSDFLSLALGKPNSETPLELRVEASFGYYKEMNVTFTSLLVQRLENASRENPLVKQEKERAARVANLIANNKMAPPLIQASSEGLFAHAPSTLILPTHAGALHLGFGIRDGAWKGEGNTNGVCFVVRSKLSMLFERCLDPKTSLADRGPQEAIVNIPAEATEVSLDTLCKENCRYDWSYWSAAVQQQ